MRAHATLRGLAPKVAALVIVPVAGASPSAAEFADLERLVPAVHVVEPGEPSQWLVEPRGRSVLQQAAPLPSLAAASPPAALDGVDGLIGDDIDVVWVHRVYLIGVGFGLAERLGARLVVDSDDDDVTTLGLLADLHQKRGEFSEARRCREQAAAFARLLAATLPSIDQLVVASPADAGPDRALTQRWGRRPVVVPNIVDIPVVASAPASHGAERRALFVGSSGYLPNLDAAERLAGPIADQLGRQGDSGIMSIVGYPQRTDETSKPNVERCGPVADLAPHYRRAAVGVVPLRAGGGTRIKILECLAWGRPVVATPIGASGLDHLVGHGVVLADDDATITERLVELWDDPGHARALGAEGRRLVEQHHGLGAIGPPIDAIVNGLSA